ncbi:hypothetical protein EI555_012853, partial [Monodon monoceros]
MVVFVVYCMVLSYVSFPIIGHQLSKPPLITQMEQEDEMEIAERRIHQDTCSGAHQAYMNVLPTRSVPCAKHPTILYSRNLSILSPCLFQNFFPLCSDELILLKTKQQQQKQGILEKYTLNGKKEQTLGGSPIQCSETVEALSVKFNITQNKIYPSKKPHRYFDSAKALRDSSRLKPSEGILPREKSYECKKDENAFLRSSNLAGHKRQHTEETSHERSDLGKVVNSISHLKKDEKTHSREKPFACNQ